MVIRQGGRIMARHMRQPANQRSRQVIAGHWAGLVPQRAIEAASTLAPGDVMPMAEVRSSALARPLSDYAAVIEEAG